jgi:hypothetical protein
MVKVNGAAMAARSGQAEIATLLREEADEIQAELQAMPGYAPDRNLIDRAAEMLSSLYVSEAQTAEPAAGTLSPGSTEPLDSIAPS